VRQTLPKSNILRGYQSFKNIITNGVSFKGTLLSVFVVNDAGKKMVSVGFSVPKKRVALAVHRNRIRRLIREAVRKNFESVQTTAEKKNIGMDIVVIYRGDKNADIHRLKLRDIEPEWIRIQQQILQTL
jgi:ribonuclease P protein component